MQQVTHSMYVIVFQVRIARIFNTYGPRMCTDDGRVVSNFVAQVSPNTIFHIFSLRHNNWNSDIKQPCYCCCVPAKA